MPHVFLAKNYIRVKGAKEAGFTTCSLQGSSRSAKTYSVVQFLCMYCFHNAGTTVSIIRAGMPSIKRTVYRDFKDVMLSFGWWEDKSMNKSEFVYTFPNGSWIEFFSTDNEQKVRGSKRKILFVNEANELSFLEWQQLQMRTTEFSILDYNPSFSEDHWINQVNEENSTYWFISTYKDNPFLEPKVIAEIESLKWKNPSLWRIYGQGLRAVVEGLIFENVIIGDYIPAQAYRQRFIGMDFGYANDATAIVEVCISGNNLYLNEICYKTHMLTDEIIHTLKSIKGSPEIISESADPRLVDEIYNAGVDIKPVKKFPGSINAGIMKMQQYKIHVTTNSTNMRKEFNNYTWRQDKEGKWLNEPIDMWNHCFTGDTLILTDIGLKRIDCINIGDNVMTSKGYRKVTNLFAQGCRAIRVVRFGFGNFSIEIQATPDHKFKTKEGWKELQNLTTNDTIYLYKYLMERNITFIMKKDISRVVSIDNTGMYGEAITEKHSLQPNTIETDFVVEAVAESIITLKEYEQLTYDIEVEDMHEFFANGILVHNCIDATRYVILEKVLGAYGNGLTASEILGII